MAGIRIENGTSGGGGGTSTFADGSAGSPSITFTADTNTGIFRKGDDNMALVTAGLEGLELLKSTGAFTNIGIGGVPSTSDTQPLLVKRDHGTSTKILVSNTNDGGGSSSILEILVNTAGNGGDVIAVSSASAATELADRLSVRSNAAAAGLNLMSLNGSGDIRFYVGGFVAGNRKMSINSSAELSVNTTSTGAQMHVDQASASGAKPVLTLTQTDIDDTFINYAGTSAADGTRSISSDTTEDSAKFGAIRCEINGVTKWIRVYDDES